MQIPFVYWFKIKSSLYGRNAKHVFINQLNFAN
jgi:hypothetical protein